MDAAYPCAYDGVSNSFVVAARMLRQKWLSKGVGASVEEAKTVLQLVNETGLRFAFTTPAPTVHAPTLPTASQELLVRKYR